jgi:hypothetical protein
MPDFQFVKIATYDTKTQQPLIPLSTSSKLQLSNIPKKLSSSKHDDSFSDSD